MREINLRETKEETIYFDLPHTKDLRIKGILRGKLNGPVAIIVHGRPGHGNDLLQYLAACYLASRGIATLRLFMYDFAPRTRNLLDDDCTSQAQAEDFSVVVERLRQRGAKKIFGVGHSYGGLTILKSEAKLDGAVLWDPTHGSWWSENRGDDPDNVSKYPEVKVGDYIIGTAGSGWMYPARAEAEDKKLGDTSAWAAKDYPLLVISAGQGKLTDLGARYFEAARHPKKHAVIQEANHNFLDSDSVMFDLFDQTCQWIDPIIRG